MNVYEVRMFDTSAETFPIKNEMIFLGHCAVSPLYKKAAAAMQSFVQDLADGGISALPKYVDVLPRLHSNLGRFLHTSAENISFVHNTAEALSMIANGYPFSEGDEVISYRHEYPSNHYPWLLQNRRGVKLVLLSDGAPLIEGETVQGPTGWSMEELEERISPRTKIVALSHVQFTSGYAADLRKLGALCKDKGVDLVVDCAQSLGCLPVYPEEYGIDALVCSGWKWLMGPKGSGLLYTSPSFREKIRETMAGPGLMQQGLNYLDLRWNPHVDGRKFEYSTLPWDHAGAMNTIMEDIFLRYRMEDIRDQVFRLQDRLLERMEAHGLTFLRFDVENRSGILAASSI